MAEAITLHIEGMTCTSCAEHVQQALTNVPGVRAASVSYPHGLPTRRTSLPAC